MSLIGSIVLSIVVAIVLLALVYGAFLLAVYMKEAQ